MLSYRHGYHAGNHADVLKHAVYAFCLAYLTRKEKPLLLLDTHAGGGVYDLQSPEAQKTGEFRDGVAKVFGRDDAPALLTPWLDRVTAYNADGVLRRYPGSPALALDGARSGDRLAFFELHGNEESALARVVGKRPNLSIQNSDGLQGLLALTPPPERRMLALIDPSYEIKSDYADVVAAVAKAWRKFPSGCYLIWRPVIDRPRTDAMAKGLAEAGLSDIYDIELCMAPDTEEHGMTGSGLWIVNPPYTLPDAAREALPWLAETLGAAGPVRSEWLIGE